MLAGYQLTDRLEQNRARIDQILSHFLATTPQEGEIVRPPRLLAAMRHGALGGGKAVRSFLMAETARMLGREDEGVAYAGAALECVHCYSLIHDDLPAMDNDELRRGKPTVHIAFDETTAILAGDSLLSLSFDLITSAAIHKNANIRLQLAQELARVSGVGGMAGGQFLDCCGDKNARDENEILQLHAMKTGALFVFAVRSGGLLANADADTLKDLVDFGKLVGQAYQLSDDLIDACGDTAIAGKLTGKDITGQRPTLIAEFGVEYTRGRLQSTLIDAQDILNKFGSKATILHAFVTFLATRQR